MTRLHPHIQVVWSLKWLVIGIIAGIGGGIAITFISAVDSQMILIAIVFPIGGSGIAYFRYRAFRYEIRDDGIYLQRGVVTRKETFVPAESIQQVDVKEQLLARLFGLVYVQVYTAGVFGGQITIPGVSSECANDLSHQLNQLAGGEQTV